MNKYWITAASIVAIAMAIGAFFVGRHTAAPPSQPTGAGTLQGRPLVDVSAAIASATRHVAGEVLKVELEREDGRFVYEVKILATDGRVREVELDSRDGSLIEIEDD